MKATVQHAALIFGVVFILIAILGFIASGSSMDPDPATAPKVLGLFAVNLVHNGVHLGFGIWGLLASRVYEGARNYGRIGGILYLILAVLGAVVPDGFGLVPLGGHDVWLHALLGIALAAVGFTARPVSSAAA